MRNVIRYCRIHISLNSSLIFASFTQATKSSAIVSSLFPSNVRDRLFEDAVEPKAKSNAFKMESTKNIEPAKYKLRSMLTDGKSQVEDEDANGGGAARPIADLFTDCTVMFADIAGENLF